MDAVHLSETSLLYFLHGVDILYVLYHVLFCEAWSLASHEIPTLADKYWLITCVLPSMGDPQEVQKYVN
jgi:hypothetical protein